MLSVMMKYKKVRICLLLNMKMLKQLTWMGKMEDDPHKEFWWAADPVERLKIANNHILQIYQIGSWEKFPMQKDKVSIRKLSQE